MGREGLAAVFGSRSPPPRDPAMGSAPTSLGEAGVEVRRARSCEGGLTVRAKYVINVVINFDIEGGQETFEVRVSLFIRG